MSVTAAIAPITRGRGGAGCAAHARTGSASGQSRVARRRAPRPRRRDASRCAALGVRAAQWSTISSSSGLDGRPAAGAVRRPPSRPRRGSWSWPARRGRPGRRAAGMPARSAGSSPAECACPPDGSRPSASSIATVSDAGIVTAGSTGTDMIRTSSTAARAEAGPRAPGPRSRRRSRSRTCQGGCRCAEGRRCSSDRPSSTARVLRTAASRRRRPSALVESVLEGRGRDERHGQVGPDRVAGTRAASAPAAAWGSRRSGRRAQPRPARRP